MLFSPDFYFRRLSILMRRILGAAWVPTRISRVFLHPRQCKSGCLLADCSGLVAKKLSDVSQHLGVHGRRNFTSLRVLLAGMIYAEQSGRGWRQLNFSSMCEAVRRARSDEPSLLQHLNVGIPGDAA